MPAPRKFDAETRERAVRLYTDRLRDHGESKLAARRHVGELLGINPATIRNWVEAEYCSSVTAGPTVADPDPEELRRLRQENAELRRANEILKTASAFFAQAELDRKLR
ncbi:MAG: transposase [Corynebacterium sp.]|uniref:transposase n=1 Tax=Corynebacterium sp. TaxID=1720 RepID=UPI00264842BA|nr:transposase [Corynebacterium sp.]MDN5724187.1 transposase [Corynebacterium sp.]